MYSHGIVSFFRYLNGPLMSLMVLFCWGESGCSEKEVVTNLRDKDIRTSIQPDLSMLFNDMTLPTQTPDEKQAVEDNWALRETRAIEAWQLVRARGREPGEGVVIAHPDTGISRHPELLANSTGPSPVLWDLGRDFVDNDKDPSHDFSSLNRIPLHGHGTETASVIVSPLGCPLAGSPGPCVTGAAPAARLIPLRVSNTVILLSGDRLAKAVDYAIEANAHVISIAMGGITPMKRLEDSISKAIDRGIIVVAAAGNGTGRIVTMPASFDNVVCVAGVSSSLKPWKLSARGPRVDIAAPAEKIFHARTTGTLGGGEKYSVGLARGTSDATALTTAAAALWLSYHGREALIARYGASGVPKLFRRLIRQVAFRPLPGWPTNGRWGPGLLDMVRLLEAELP